MTIQVQEIPLEKLSVDPGNPRKHFDKKSMDELTSSIKAKGVITPILVREAEESSGTYKIIAGERRYRAAKAVGLKAIPSVIREQLTEAEAMELQIIENLQREDL